MSHLPLLTQCRWLGPLLKERRALAVCRADEAEQFKYASTLRFLYNATAPVVAVVDLDPEGLMVARDCPRLEAICRRPRGLRVQLSLPPADSSERFAQQV